MIGWMSELYPVPLCEVWALILDDLAWTTFYDDFSPPRTLLMRLVVQLWTLIQATTGFCLLHTSHQLEQVNCQWMSHWQSIPSMDLIQYYPCMKISSQWFSSGMIAGFGTIIWDYHPRLMPWDLMNMSRYGSLILYSKIPKRKWKVLWMKMQLWRLWERVLDPWVDWIKQRINMCFMVMKTTLSMKDSTL